MIKSFLTDYNFPEDLKEMSEKELELLTFAIRDFLIEHVSKTGGHIASGLGAVELSIALHKVFDSPRDKIIWDVGHQTYVHKILTGRAADFPSLRQMGGLSGFPKMQESEHDMFDAGHSSSSLSFAAGMAAARDLKKENYNIIAVIGDGALTGGLAYEALNNIGDAKTRLIVILNDNGMSIAPNTGSVSKHLGRLRASRKYLHLKKNVRKRVSKIPNIGDVLLNGMVHFRNTIKYSVIEEGVLFEELGFKYYGPVDGHSLPELLETLNATKEMTGPVLIHAITKKGKGYSIAETHPDKFHGIDPFDPATGELVTKSDKLSYSDIYGNELIKIAGENDNVVAICAAMIDGTGLNKFKDVYSDRIFDVGIAEEHAVTFAAGMARSGYRPFVTIYSTFLQRAYDEIIEDVCLQKFPVVFALDRAGVVGADGETHHGIFDLSYLSHMPNMTIMAPSSGEELKMMLRYALALGGPCAIRYPRGTADMPASQPVSLEKGVSQIISTGRDAEIWAVGNMLSTAVAVSEKLKLKRIDTGVVNVRFVKPLDKKGLLESSVRAKNIITIEDNVVTGGFGQQAAVFLEESGAGARIKICGWPDEFIEHGTCKQLRVRHFLDETSLTERISDFIEGKA